MSADSLLSVIASVPAVTGAASAASAAGEGDASTFGGLLADAVAGEGDAASAEDAKAPADIAQTVPAVPPPVMPMLVVEAETRVEPSVLPGQEPTPAPDFTALLKTAAEPQVLQGPGEAAQPSSKTAVSPEVLPDVADLPAQPGPATKAEAPAPTPVPSAEVTAAVAAAVAAVTAPPVRPAPDRTSPQAPTDKSVTKTSGEDTGRPNVLHGPGDAAPQEPRPIEPGVGPERPRPGLTMKTDGATPAVEAAPQPAVLAEPAAPAGQSSDIAPKVDTAAPVVIARDASLSSLSRATIETTAHLAAQITRKLEGRSTRFEMALTPEGLGRVDVSLDIDADGQLAARLAFDNPVAAMDLRGRVDELRRQLEDQGFKLADDALQFTERDPQSRGDGFDGRRERAFARSNRLNDDADLEIGAPVAGRWMSLSLTPDRVDLKV